MGHNCEIIDLSQDILSSEDESSSNKKQSALIAKGTEKNGWKTTQYMFSDSDEEDAMLSLTERLKRKRGHSRITLQTENSESKPTATSKKHKSRKHRAIELVDSPSNIRRSQTVSGRIESSAQCNVSRLKRKDSQVFDLSSTKSTPGSTENVALSSNTTPLVSDYNGSLSIPRDPEMYRSTSLPMAFTREVVNNSQGWCRRP